MLVNVHKMVLLPIRIHISYWATQGPLKKCMEHTQKMYSLKIRGWMGVDVMHHIICFLPTFTSSSRGKNSVKTAEFLMNDRFRLLGTEFSTGMKNTKLGDASWVMPSDFISIGKYKS